MLKRKCYLEDKLEFGTSGISLPPRVENGFPRPQFLDSYNEIVEVHSSPTLLTRVGNTLRSPNVQKKEPVYFVNHNGTTCDDTCQDSCYHLSPYQDVPIKNSTQESEKLAALPAVTLQLEDSLTNNGFYLKIFYRFLGHCHGLLSGPAKGNNSSFNLILWGKGLAIFCPRDTQKCKLRSNMSLHL